MLQCTMYTVISLIVFCLSTELIYEEVIDWEERNKNGLMKEDCSGTCMNHLQSLIRLFVQLPKLCTIWFPPLCVSYIRSRVRFSLPVLLSQRHLVHVHRAHLGFRHRQQQHRHTDGTAGRESVNRNVFASTPPLAPN